MGFSGGSDNKESTWMWETQVWSLAWEDPLEKKIILAWRIPWTEKPGKLQSMGSKESDMTNTHTQTILYEESAILYIRFWYSWGSWKQSVWILRNHCVVIITG